MTQCAQSTSLERRALRLEYTTVGWNTLEAAVALAAGVAAGSIALVGFGLDSAIEVFSASVVIWQLRGASEARERRALRLIGLTFFALAAYVGFESLRDLFTQSRSETSVPGVVVSAAALIVMPTLAWAKRRTGRALGSRTILADAAETLFCAWLAAATLAGLLLNATLGWWWADPVAGLVIAAFAIKEGREAFDGEDDDDD